MRRWDMRLIIMFWTRNKQKTQELKNLPLGPIIAINLPAAKFPDSDRRIGIFALSPSSTEKLTSSNFKLIDGQEGNWLSLAFIVYVFFLLLWLSAFLKESTLSLWSFWNPRVNWCWIFFLTFVFAHTILTSLTVDPLQLMTVATRLLAIITFTTLFHYAHVNVPSLKSYV